MMHEMSKYLLLVLGSIVAASSLYSGDSARVVPFDRQGGGQDALRWAPATAGRVPERPGFPSIQWRCTDINYTLKWERPASRGSFTNLSLRPCGP